MADKKEYQAILKMLEALATADAINNRLTSIAVETEDEKLKTALGVLARLVREKKYNSTWRKGRLAGIQPSSESTVNGQIAGAVAQIKAYCEAMIASHKPQWQVLAERAGWTPPAIARTA